MAADDTSSAEVVALIEAFFGGKELDAIVTRGSKASSFSETLVIGLASY